MRIPGLNERHAHIWKGFENAALPCDFRHSPMPPRLRSLAGFVC
jgi:hypothetical protein